MKENDSVWDATDFEKQGFVYLFLSISSAVLGVYGNYGFSQADYWVYGWADTDEWTSTYGYNAVDFVYFVLGSYFFPLSIVLMLVFMSHSYKRTTSAFRKYVVYVPMLIGFIIAAVFSFMYARNVLTCISFYCMGGAEYNSTAEPVATFLGTLYFFVCLLFSFGYILLIVMTYSSDTGENNKTVAVGSGETDRLMGEENRGSTHFHTSKQGINKQLYSSRFQTTGNVSSVAKSLIIAFVLLILYPIFFFACMLLPTWWNLFTWSGIQYYQSYTPDLSLGYYFSFTVREVVAKLFPDIILFYGFIYVVSITALLSAWIPSLNALLRSRPNWLHTFSVGQVLLATFMTLMVVGQFFYWFYDHGWEGVSRHDFTYADNAARAAGQMANVCLGLLLLPASKNNVWGLMFDVSWESMLVWHQVLGYCFLAAVFLHMCLFWVVFSQNGSFPHDILNVPEYYHGTNFAVPLGQLTYYVALLALGVLTFYQIRRYWYELFYYVHVTFVPILILVVLWHATMAWYYLIGGIVLWVCDIIIRLTTNVTTDVMVQDLSVVVRASLSSGTHPLSSGTQQQQNKDVVGGVVCLSYTVNSRLGLIKLSPDADTTAYHPNGKPLTHEMGQYVFLNIPEVDLMEWHPFTISSAPVDGVTTHHIKAMGTTEWTGRLYALAQELDTLLGWEKTDRLSGLKVALDGPYGVPLRVSAYTHILLVAGGIGVTPLLAVFRQLYLQATNQANPAAHAHLRSVRLVWILKNAAEIATGLDTLCRFPSSGVDGIFSISLHLTQSKKTPDFEKNITETRVEALLGLAQYVHSGRPSLHSEMAALRVHGQKSCVFTCGPQELVDECSTIAMHSGVDFKFESFLF